MLKRGVFTMHDFHPFRQLEFNKCIQRGEFPCRWAVDSGKGYGEPMFVYYGQIPYWIGGIFSVMGFGVLDSFKATIIFTFLVSGLGMYLLARKFWPTNGAILSAVLYSYAPYRAVDVWVRGALSETMAFVFYPLILLVVDNFMIKKSVKNFVWLSLLLAGLICTHNLSAYMFLPFLILWTFWRWREHKGNIHHLYDMVSAGFTAVLISSFYWLPVLFESGLVTVSQTTEGYYGYGVHFTTLYRLFVSSFWGYGGSVWGDTQFMSFSIGYLHWLLPAVTLFVWLYLKLRGEKIEKSFYVTLVLSIIGILAVFLTHGKSVFLWKIIPAIAYIQFPWRFLGIASLFLSLAGGGISMLFSSWLISVILVAAVVVNVGNFRPDIWKDQSDKEYFSGDWWEVQKSSALSDFWPKSAGELPKENAPINSEIIMTTDKFQKIRFPIVYFPGWMIKTKKELVQTFPSGDHGLVTAKIFNEDLNNYKLIFTDTAPRKIGNIVSFISIACLFFVFTKYAKK
jgi:hypothetical protein